jgi:hypothetical protein
MYAADLCNDFIFVPEEQVPDSRCVIMSGKVRKVRGQPWPMHGTVGDRWVSICYSSRLAGVDDRFIARHPPAQDCCRSRSADDIPHTHARR